MKDYTLIDKSETMKCWKCSGKGTIHEVIDGKHTFKKCDLCNGSGDFRESHYIVIDEKNKIACDTDCDG